MKVKEWRCAGFQSREAFLGGILGASLQVSFETRRDLSAVMGTCNYRVICKLFSF